MTPMTANSDLIANALDFIAEFELDDEMRKQFVSWETGTGDESDDLILDRGARIIRELIAEADAARRATTLAEIYCAVIESRLEAKDTEIAALTARLALAEAVCEAFSSWSTEHGPTHGAESDRWTAIFAAVDAWRARTPTDREPLWSAAQRGVVGGPLPRKGTIRDPSVWEMDLRGSVAFEAKDSEIVALRAEKKRLLEDLEQFAFDYEEKRQAWENERSYQLVRHLLPTSDPVDKKRTDFTTSDEAKKS